MHMWIPLHWRIDLGTAQWAVPADISLYFFPICNFGICNEIQSGDLELEGWRVKTLPINFHRRLYREATRRHFYTDCLPQLEKPVHNICSCYSVTQRVEI